MKARKRFFPGVCLGFIFGIIIGINVADHIRNADAPAEQTLLSRFEAARVEVQAKQAEIDRLRARQSKVNSRPDEVVQPEVGAQTN
ncbi:MAG TPA: hypothetical protein VKA67_11375 [Verrucomicrobiae bacterium]|nr:hypothetical protein [Verrucomicrobiae bacterium]